MKTFTFKKNFAPLWLAVFVLALVTTLSLTQPNSEMWIAWSVVGLIALATLYGFFASHAKIDSSQLYIQADLYSYKIKLEDITQIKEINLKLEPSLHAGFRSWGTSLPTYNTGNFTLANQQKGYLFVSDDQHVIHIQTKENTHILLSLENPEAFIAALKEAHANT
jgi:hypothetical protein